MPLTKLDKTCALITIDLQKGITGLPAVHPINEIIARAAQLARAFREGGLPVVLVNVTGTAPGRTDVGPRSLSSLPSDWTELVPELGQTPSDCLLSKQRWGAFVGTELDSYLRRRGVTQLVMTGISTSAGVESTARNAYDLGYNVILVLDAMTDRDADAHRHCVEKIFPRLGETTNTDDVLKLLDQARGRFGL
jgi:nicotinamidase-related amidase